MSELDKQAESWNKYRKRIETLLHRQKRIIPILMPMTTMVMAALSLGTSYKNTKVTQSHDDQIVKLTDTVNEHTNLFVEGIKFAEYYRKGIKEMETWSHDVEERLGSDKLIYRSAKE